MNSIKKILLIVMILVLAGFTRVDADTDIQYKNQKLGYSRVMPKSGPVTVEKAHKVTSKQTVYHVYNVEKDEDGKTIAVEKETRIESFDGYLNGASKFQVSENTVYNIHGNVITIGSHKITAEPYSNFSFFEFIVCSERNEALEQITDRYLEESPKTTDYQYYTNKSRAGEMYNENVPDNCILYQTCGGEGTLPAGSYVYIIAWFGPKTFVSYY